MLIDSNTQLAVGLDTVTDLNNSLHSIRTRRVIHVPVTRVNTMARVPMHFCLTLSTRALVLQPTQEASVRVSNLYTSHRF
jgi:hypothetical protein